VLTSPSQQVWAAPETHCDWKPVERPHISSFNLQRNKKVDIKTGTEGTCEPSPDPISITAQVTLEVQGSFFLWSPMKSARLLQKISKALPRGSGCVMNFLPLGPAYQERIEVD